MAGETFSSRRSKKAGGMSLRQHSIDLIAKKLRELPDQDPDQLSVHVKDACIQEHLAKTPRMNRIFHSYRFLVCMFGGFSVGVMFLLRYNITISILKMVNQTHLYLEEHPGKTVEDMIAAGQTPGGEFNWNNEIQHMIMSWYMVAYTLPQMPATKLGTMMGTRWAVPISLSLCSISTILVPYFAYLGWEYVIVLRLINGLGASAVFPLLLTLVENWMRPDEISLGLSYAQGLVTILAATNPLIAGYLSSIHWSLSFYVPGVATLIFCLLWLILITDNPMDNLFVSEKELKHICEYEMEQVAAAAAAAAAAAKKQLTGAMNTNQTKAIANSSANNTNNNTKQNDDEPDENGLQFKPDSWLQVLKVPSFYAYLIIWCFYCSSYSGFSFILPTYMRQFLKIPIAQNGLYCFIVQSGAILAVMWPHPILRLLEQKLHFSVQNSRRIGHLICCGMVAATWVYVGAFHESQLLLLFLNRCFHNGNDIVVTGCLMSNYAKAGLSSVVFSMVNTIGNLSVVFTSTFIGWLLDYTGQSRHGWTMIFSGMGISQLLMWILFSTCVSSGPIKFRNKRAKADFESKLQRSVSAQFEQGHSLPAAANKSNNEAPMLNNFDKLRGVKNNNQPAEVGAESQESKQIL